MRDDVGAVPGPADDRWLTDRFAEQTPHLRSVAYRMLGSASDADDAVQDTWLRVHGADTGAVENLTGWLTTITARVCLNMLRARGTKSALSLDAPLPDPVVTPDHDTTAPEEQAELADSVGIALLVVLDTLGPAERLAFVLHDMFDLPFDQIAPMVDRTPQAARQLASRARRRVTGADLPTPDPDRHRQRAVVDAFFAASRSGDFEALVALLDPDVTLRTDSAKRRSQTFTGARDVARQALLGALPGARLHNALVDGRAGVVVTVNERPFAIMGFTVVDGRIAEIDAIADPARVRELATAVLAPGD